MCTSQVYSAILNPSGIGPGKGVKGLLPSVSAPAFKAPALSDAETTKKAALASAEAQKLKAIAAHSLSDTKHTGPKGLGGTPNGNKLYAELLGG